MITRTRTALSAVLLSAALALAGCSASPSTPVSSPDAQTPACVTVVVDFGPIDAPSIDSCVDAGPAKDVLEAAGVTTEGTLDYGDQVVCRVNDLPSPDEEVVIEGQAPFVETCATLNSLAYWALWVRSTPDAEWEYAQEGVVTLVLTEGQSVGLVYTPGTDSVPPQG